MQATISLPNKLIPVFDGPADVRGAFGGRGSAKTRSFAKMAAVRGYMFGMAGISGQILCARQYMNSLDDSSLEEIKRAIDDEPWLAAYYDIGEKYIKSRDGRVWFSFAGLDRSIGSIKSKGRILLCWVDEAEPVTDNAWSILIPTLREEGDGWNAELWITWNPARKTAAVESRFRNASDPLIKVAKLNWRDNPKFPDKLERERQRDMQHRPDQYEHIWEGKFVSAVEGAYFAKHLAIARQERRLGRIGRDPLMSAYAFWDIGGAGAKSDACAIWLAQFVSKEIRFIDYYEAQGQPLASHVEWLRANGYERAEMVLPHDGRQTDKFYGITYESELRKAGFSVRVIDNQGAGAATQRIEAARGLFPQMWFDEEKCSAGLDAIGWYHEKRDENRGIGLGPNHDWSSHGCLIAGSTVETGRGSIPIEKVCIGDTVLTPSGYAIVDNSGMSKISTELIDIELSDGKIITMTPEHKVFTTEGVLTADSLGYNVGIITIEDLPCIQLANAENTGYRDAFIESTKASSIGYGKKEACIARKRAVSKGFCTGNLRVLSQDRSSHSPLMGTGKTLIAKIGGCARKIGEESKRSLTSLKSSMAFRITGSQTDITSQNLLSMAESSCIESYGNISTAAFRLDSMSTTETVSGQTTLLKTLSASSLISIYQNMQKKVIGSAVKKIRNSLLSLKKKPRNGTEAKMVESGIVSNQENRLRIDKKPPKLVSNAGKNTKQNGQENQSIVTSIVSKKRYTKEVPVYDLTVRKHHCYFANGILVSNSDAFGMVAVAYDKIANTTKRKAHGGSTHWMG